MKEGVVVTALFVAAAVYLAGDPPRDAPPDAELAPLTVEREFPKPAPPLGADTVWWMPLRRVPDERPSVPLLPKSEIAGVVDQLVDVRRHDLSFPPVREEVSERFERIAELERSLAGREEEAAECLVSRIGADGKLDDRDEKDVLALGGFAGSNAAKRWALTLDWENAPSMALSISLSVWQKHTDERAIPQLLHMLRNGPRGDRIGTLLCLDAYGSAEVVAAISEVAENDTDAENRTVAEQCLERIRAGEGGETR